MNPIVCPITIAAGDPDGISLSQTPTAALTITGAFATGGVATLSPPQRVSITSTSDISNRTFTIVGTDRYGNAQTEVLTGPNNTTVYTLADFATVTSITISGLAAGALTVGTNAIASGPWLFPTREITPFNLVVALENSGTTSQVDYTYDDPNWVITPWGTTVEPLSSRPPTVWQLPTMTGVSGNAEGSFERPCFAFRITVTAGAGTATLKAIQAGIVQG